MAGFERSDANSHGHVVDVSHGVRDAGAPSLRGATLASSGRRSLIAALALVLSTLTVLVARDSFSSPIGLQESASVWARTVLSKMTSPPIYILPDISAAEQGKEAATKARELDASDLGKGSKDPSSQGSAFSVTGGLLHIIRSITAGSPTVIDSQTASQDASSSMPKGFSFKIDRHPQYPLAVGTASPFRISSAIQAAPQWPLSEPTMSNSPFQFASPLPLQDATSPGAQMIENPVPSAYAPQMEEEPQSQQAWTVGQSSPQASSEPEFSPPVADEKPEFAPAADEKEPEKVASNESEGASAPSVAQENFESRGIPLEITVNLPSTQIPSAAVEPKPEVENSDVDAKSEVVNPIEEHFALQPTVHVGQSFPVQFVPSVQQVDTAPVFSSFPEISVASWSYHGAATGPDQWGTLGYTTCSDGANQSPINIESNVEGAGLPILAWGIPESSDAFLTGNADVGALFNGRTFEVVGLDALMSIDGLEYSLKQIHVHTPSEHTFDGQHYDMELHFVHSAIVEGQARYMIVATLFREAKESIDFINEFSLAIPSLTSSETDLHIDFAHLAMSVLGQMQSVNPTVTNAQNYFQYNGSFTAPPCAEGVTWVILKNALPISLEDLRAFTQLEGKNNRPVQALNGRVVYDSHLSA